MLVWDAPDGDQYKSTMPPQEFYPENSYQDHTSPF